VLIYFQYILTYTKYILLLQLFAFDLLRRLFWKQFTLTNVLFKSRWEVHFYCILQHPLATAS